MSRTPGDAAVQRLEGVGTRRLVATACVLSLVALALMVWSVLDPTPLPVMIVMSVGQVIGTLGLVCYLAAVVVFQWKRRKPAASPPREDASPDM
jgi:hypothetical protein